MIWRTCGSLRTSSARSAYSTRAVGFGGARRHQAEVLRRVGVLAQLAQAAGQLGGGSERRHPVAADQPRDRRVVDARLLGELPLGHLLGLELGSQPFVEGSSVLGRHMGPLGTPLGDDRLATELRDDPTRPVASLSPVGTDRARARAWRVLPVWCGPDRSGVAGRLVPLAGRRCVAVHEAQLEAHGRRSESEPDLGPSGWAVRHWAGRATGDYREHW